MTQVSGPADAGHGRGAEVGTAPDRWVVLNAMDEAAREAIAAGWEASLAALTAAADRLTGSS